MINRIFICFITLWYVLFPSLAITEIKDSAFKQYDIRGNVETEIDIDEVYDLARAIAFYYKESHPELKTIALGMDGRLSSPAIHEKVSSGLIDSGLDVISIGLCTSPVLYFATETMNVEGGIMITASHNPKGDNGLKLNLDKEPICGEELQTIRKNLRERKSLTNNSQGILQCRSITEEYVSWLAEQFSHLKGSSISVLFDCGNGAAGAIMPRLIEAMEWENAGLLFAEVDGNFPNRSSDPTKEKNMVALRDELETTSYDVGIAFDGDGDRMVAMTKDGYLVPGDKLLAIFGKQIARNNPGANVVFDLSCSTGLHELLSAAGAVPIMSPIGAVNVRKMMNTHKALLGGEISCHFFFSDRHFGYDDGIYAAMRLIESMHDFDQSLEELIADFPVKISSPTIRMPCAESLKSEVIASFEENFLDRDDVTCMTIDGVRVAFEKGWGLVRPSNTEPKLSLRFEADTPEDLAHIKEEFSVILEQFFEREFVWEYLQ